MQYKRLKNGIYQLVLWRGWAIGVGPLVEGQFKLSYVLERDIYFHFCQHDWGVAKAWQVRVLWFYFGRKRPVRP